MSPCFSGEHGYTNKPRGPQESRNTGPATEKRASKRIATTLLSSSGPDLQQKVKKKDPRKLDTALQGFIKVHMTRHCIIEDSGVCKNNNQICFQSKFIFQQYLQCLPCHGAGTQTVTVVTFELLSLKEK